MDSLHTINGKPIDATAAVPVSATPTASEPAAKQTHKDECGAVGITGEHGDLGSNAK